MANAFNRFGVNLLYNFFDSGDKNYKVTLKDR
jgi:hypothetical protein